MCGGVDRLVLALQQARGFGRHPAEHLPVGVDDVPLPVHSSGSGNKRTHGSLSAFLRLAQRTPPCCGTGPKPGGQQSRLKGRQTKRIQAITGIVKRVARPCRRNRLGRRSERGCRFCDYETVSRCKLSISAFHEPVKTAQKPFRSAELMPESPRVAPRLPPLRR